MSSLQKAKKALRRSALEKRDRLPENERELQNIKIHERLEELMGQDAEPIHCYVSFKTEVDTLTLIQKWCQEQRPLMCPRMKEDGQLSHHWVRELSDLQRHRMGILEPRESCPVADPHLAQWIIVPGLAFSESGQRLGYGAGYYDRFLSFYKARKVGLAFDQQMYRELPTELHDMNMDWVLTAGQVWASS
jgi:5-formyltetrahydrofolate cyclo-ligase